MILITDKSVINLDQVFGVHMIDRKYSGENKSFDILIYYGNGSFDRNLEYQTEELRDKVYNIISNQIIHQVHEINLPEIEEQAKLDLKEAKLKKQKKIDEFDRWNIEKTFGEDIEPKRERLKKLMFTLKYGGDWSDNIQEEISQLKK